MGLSVTAILLAVVLVVGLLAWVRRDLRARRAPMRAWWLVVGCYVLAAVAWLIAITVPLPVTLAWLATIPAAVATVIPDRLAAWIGGIGGSGRGRRRPPLVGVRPAPHASGAHRAMARPMGAPKPAEGVVRRRPSPSRAPTPEQEAAPIRDWQPAQTSDIEPTSSPKAQPTPTAEVQPTPAAQPTRQRHAPALGRHRWAPGDLRLAVELLEDAARIPDLDDAARVRIEARLDRLERFHGPATDELLDLVRADVHARLAAEVPAIDPDPARARRIATLVDELDPRPA